jgi:hypothetical protein
MQTFSGANTQWTLAATMTSATESPGSCIVDSAVQAQSNLQLEDGLVRCAPNTSIDGTCPGGRTFVETSKSGIFTCYPHGTFQNGSWYELGADRTSSNGWVARGRGVDYEGISSGWNSTFYARTWGEWTSGASTTYSGWSGRAQFGSWKYKTSSGSSVWFTNSNTAVATTCWSVGSLANPTGGAYSVSH